MRDRIGRKLQIMLDDFDKLSAADESGFLARLWALPGSYDGPDGRRTEPYGLIGFGETAPSEPRVAKLGGRASGGVGHAVYAGVGLSTMANWARSNSTPR